mmetsp:Transcript_4660/g.4370  ORF Transcript_4660/g.4370 Transcript_4660/m.4370 type:complete len:161 (-) Transcript_4660:839-1321(-)
MERHKDTCEFQLVKCPYYNLGCKIEILRKDYKAHLHEESFNHSIIFIEGQKKKNKEIDELKHEIVNLRKDYDVEIKSMFLELNRVKDELVNMRGKCYGSDMSSVRENLGSQNPNQVNLGQNVPQMKKDERRYEPHRSSAGSASLFDYSKAYGRDRQNNAN